MAAISRMNNHWLNQHRSSPLADYTVRRYMATQSGALYSYPGALMNQMYDPTKRELYTRAVEFAGRVTVTAPYLDEGGAGYIVTVSQAIFEGR